MFGRRRCRTRRRRREDRRRRKVVVCHYGTAFGVFGEGEHFVVLPCGTGLSFRLYRRGFGLVGVVLRVPPTLGNQSSKVSSESNPLAWLNPELADPTCDVSCTPWTDQGGATTTPIKMGRMTSDTLHTPQRQQVAHPLLYSPARPMHTFSPYGRFYAHLRLSP